MENVLRIKWFEELDSTSSELLRHVGDYDNLSVIAAVNQTAGRGQRGNHWISAPGDNLTFSFLLRPEALPAREVMALTCFATLVVRDALRAEGIPAVIKWPNDIYVGKRKICGMLVENGLEGPLIAWSVIGIGINLNQTEFPAGVQNPTSLKILTGRTFDVHAVLDRFCRGFESLYPSLATQEGRDRLRAAYEKDLFLKDSPASFRDIATGEVFTGVIRGITPEGLLRIEKAGGPERTFGFKEISYIL